jgi:hypothetical protein
MPFGRLHEEAAGDSKLLALSDGAWRMWGMGLIYCQKNLTDGFIAANAIATFGVRGPGKRSIDPDVVARELCTEQVPGKAPVWEKVDGGYRVHDYLEWNDSKDEILKMRQDKRDRTARWRERKQSQSASAGAPSDASRVVHEDAHPVVRGSSSEKEEGVDRRRTRIGARATVRSAAHSRGIT